MRLASVFLFCLAIGSPGAAAYLPRCSGIDSEAVSVVIAEFELIFLSLSGWLVRCGTVMLFIVYRLVFGECNVLNSLE